jgi:hypothetical protein
MSVQNLYRIDIGFDEKRGYACIIQDVEASLAKGVNVVKGIKGNSAEQLASRLRKVLIEEIGLRRRFPLESGKGGALISAPDEFNGG